MTTLFNDFWIAWLVGGGLILIVRIVQLFSVEKYAEALLKVTSEQLKRIIRLRTFVLKITKLILWLSPFYLVVVPIGIHLFLPEINAILIFATMVLVVLMILVEFIYTRRLLRYLEAHRPNPA